MSIETKKFLCRLTYKIACWLFLCKFSKTKITGKMPLWFKFYSLSCRLSNK